MLKNKNATSLHGMVPIREKYFKGLPSPPFKLSTKYIS